MPARTSRRAPARQTKATRPRKRPTKPRTRHVVPAAAGRPVDLDGHRGLLLVPDHARALYVLAHGAGAGMAHPFMDALAVALAGKCIATLRWEFLYMTAGKGRPDPAPIAEESVRRVWAASAALAGALPRVAGGKSFGGRMSSRAHAATPLPDLRGLVFLGFPLHPPDKPAASPGSAGARSTALAVRRSIERAEHLDAAGGPLLFIQGTRDELADLALLRPVIARLGTRATLHVVDGADHGFSLKAAVIDELATAIATWVDRILGRA